LGFVDGIHYAEFTDAAWSADGLKLLVSSKDGYCTIVVFSAEELGIPLPESEQPTTQTRLHASTHDASVVLDGKPETRLCQQ